MRYLLLAAALMLSACDDGSGEQETPAPYTPPETKPEPKPTPKPVMRSISMTFVNHCSSDIYMRVFDLVSGTTSPARDDVPFKLSPGLIAGVNAACTEGHFVCYGGTSPAANLQWGKGVNGDGICDDCCVLCSGAVAQPVSLGCQ